jgi:hypothetical protein
MKKALLFCSFLVVFGCIAEPEKEMPKDPVFDQIQSGFEVYTREDRQAGFRFQNDSLYWYQRQNGASLRNDLGTGTWRKVSGDTMALICDDCLEPSDSVYLFTPTRYPEYSLFVYNVLNYASDSTLMAYRFLLYGSNWIDTSKTLRGRFIKGY